MKISHIMAATGIVIAAIGVGTSAQADPGWHNDRHNGWKNHHRHCHMEWRHHHRVRVCR